MHRWVKRGSYFQLESRSRHEGGVGDRSRSRGSRRGVGDIGGVRKHVSSRVDALKTSRALGKGSGVENRPGSIP